MKTIGVCSTNLAPPPQGLGVVINSWGGGGLHIIHMHALALVCRNLIYSWPKAVKKQKIPAARLLPLVPWGCQNALSRLMRAHDTQ
jgi:hypothetical protein